MPKRFIDTELLMNPNLRVAPTLAKLFWVGYITLCDHAGIWPKDFELMSVLIGGKVTEEIIHGWFPEKFINVDNGRRWFSPDFIEFQYPKGLNPKVPACKSAINILLKFGLWDGDKLRVRVALVKELQDKDKDKDKEGDKDMDKDKPRKKSKKEIIEETAIEIIEIINEVSGKGFGTGSGNLKEIKMQLNKGRTIEEADYVIKNKWNEWGGYSEMEKNFNPVTLFREANFDRYTQEPIFKRHEIAVKNPPTRKNSQITEIIDQITESWDV